MRDVLDKSKALPFAWRHVRPDETIDLDAPDLQPASSSAAPSIFDDEGIPELALRRPENVEVRAEARAACACLEVMIDHAWALDGALGAAATEKIARQAAKIELQLCAIAPLEGVRMARLFVRHWEALSRGARKRAVDACIWVELGHAELGELIVEMVAADNARIAAAIGMSYDALEVVEFDKEELARRLAGLLDRSSSWSVRELAAEWISAGDVARVRTSLRRALRLPHLSIRAHAVRALEELDPPALDADDVLFLLADHVDRRIEDYGALDELDLDQYAELLRAAVVRVKPEDGEWPLLEMADPAHDHGWRDILDRDWALATLAEAYPDVAEPEIDELAQSWRVDDRRTALEAVLKLPWDRAERRLLAMAADGAPSVAQRARDVWLERTSARCPIEETAGLALELLDAPPSEAMLARLLALRNGSVEARAALAEVLLREAPDREALVLLLFALGDDGLARGGHRRLPRDEAGWARRLVARFGAIAVAGLCAICERYPQPHGYGWFFVLCQLMTKGIIKRADAAPLAALARKLLAQGVSCVYAINVLDRALAGEERAELFVELVTSGGEASYLARSALARPKHDPALDARLARALAERMASGDRAAVGGLLWVMSTRKVREADEIAARLVGEIDAARGYACDDADLEMYVVAARHLESRENLEDAWVIDALRNPGTLRCRVALDVQRVRTKPLRAHVEALLASTVLGGTVAVDAAHTLLLAKPPIAKRDPRLLGVIERAEPAPRARLLSELLLWRFPKRRLAPHVARLVATASDAEVEPLYDYLDQLSPRVLRRLVPAIKDDAVRVVVESIVGPPAEAIEWEG
jgi:hypothetical protein